MKYDNTKTLRAVARDPTTALKAVRQLLGPQRLNESDWGIARGWEFFGFPSTQLQHAVYEIRAQGNHTTRARLQRTNMKDLAGAGTSELDDEETMMLGTRAVQLIVAQLQDVINAQLILGRQPLQRCLTILQKFEDNPTNRKLRGLVAVVIRVFKADDLNVVAAEPQAPVRRSGRQNAASKRVDRMRATIYPTVSVKERDLVRDVVAEAERKPPGKVSKCS
jgi:hypothetical protein